MARGRFRSRRGSRRGFRPPTDWGAITLLGALTAGVTGTDADIWNLSNLMEDAPQPGDVHSETIRRTRGVWHAYIPTWPGGPAPGVVEVAIGIGVAPTEAITAGAVPTPIDDSYWDGWLYRSWTKFQNPAAATGGGSTGFAGYDTGTDGIYRIDSRAMRKLEDNEAFLVMDLATDTGQAVVANYAVDLRMLFSITSK